MIGTFIAAILGLSLVVVTGFAGQVSLAQLALAGTAAFTLSFLTQSWHMPFPFAPLLACLVATLIGVVVGLPALRVRGLMLGVVTLAFAYAIEAVWFRNTQIVSVSGARVDDPSLFGLDLGIGSGAAFPRLEFGLLCLFTLVGVAFGVAKLRMSRFGSAMLAVRANERSAAGVGVERRARQGPQLRAGVVHRRAGRLPARLSARRGDLRLVHRAGRARPGLDRVPRRHHVGVRWAHRGHPGRVGHRVHRRSTAGSISASGSRSSPASRSSSP